MALKIPRVKKGLTGSAYNMTIPQLNKAIEVLKSRLSEKDVKNNPTLSEKIERYIHDFTTAKSEILKIVEMAKQHNPNIIAGKTNTLTLLQIYKKLGISEGTTNKLANKGQPWAYNIADFAKDTKGLAIGVACTSVALGVANAIATSVAKKGIMALIAQGIGSAFAAAPVASALISGGLIIGAGLLIIPKIAKLVKKIKHNASVSREIRNKLLENNNANELDLSTHSAEQIKDILKSDDELRKEIISGDFNFEGYSEKDKNTLIKAAFTAENELTKESRESRIEIGKQIEINKQDEYLEEYEALSKQIMSDDDFNQLKNTIDGYTAEALTPDEVEQLTKEENKLRTLESEEDEAKTKKETLEAEVEKLKKRKEKLTEHKRNAESLKNNAKNDYDSCVVLQKSVRRPALQTDINEYFNNLKKHKQKTIELNEKKEKLISKEADLEILEEQLKAAENKFNIAKKAYAKNPSAENTAALNESETRVIGLRNQKSTLTSDINNLKTDVNTNLPTEINTAKSTIDSKKTAITDHKDSSGKKLFKADDIKNFVNFADTYVTRIIEYEIVDAKLTAVTNELGDTTKGKTKELNDATLDYTNKHNAVESFKTTDPYKKLIEKRDTYVSESAEKAENIEKYNTAKAKKERHTTLHEKLLALFGNEEGIKKAMAERHAAGLDR